MGLHHLETEDGPFAIQASSQMGRKPKGKRARSWLIIYIYISDSHYLVHDYVKNHCKPVINDYDK